MPDARQISNSCNSVSHSRTLLCCSPDLVTRLHPSTICVQSCLSRASTKRRTLTPSLNDDALSITNASASFNVLPYSRADWRSLIDDFHDP
jgi:hypothetical protein